MGEGLSASERYFPSSTTPTIWIHFAVVAVAETLADGIFAGEKLARERLIDQHHAGRVLGVALIQIAAVDEARLHRLQIAGGNAVCVRHGTSPGRGSGLPSSRIGAVGNIEGERKPVDHAGRLDAGHRADLVEQAPLKIAGAFFVVALQTRDRKRRWRRAAARIQVAG